MSCIRSRSKIVSSLKADYLKNSEQEEKKRSNLQTQLDELEMLESIYPKEFKIDDHKAIDDIKSYIKKTTQNPPMFIEFTINLVVIDSKGNEQKLEMCVTLSPDYPDALPDIYLRNSSMNREASSAINKDLQLFLKSLETRGEPCIYSAISWCLDNAQNYYSQSSTTSSELKSSSSTLASRSNDSKLIRMWIYSHHIYNKSKRREILNLAGRHNLTGFCMPGKPGIVCIEGDEDECNQWWSTIKNMTWQKIMCKATEECIKMRRFDTFEEVPFQTNGPRGNHSDLGELFKYLEALDLDFIFKELFGIEGKK